MGVFSDRAQGRANAVVPITGGDGKPANVVATIAVTATGAEAGMDSYVLASNATVAANAGAAPVTGVRRGTYVWDAQWTGTGTLRLQALGADATTWRTVAELTAPGTYAGEIRVGGNATLRVFNTNAGGGASFTALSSSLS